METEYLKPRVEPADPLDVPARLETLALLRDGWMEGQGVRLSPAGLTWLAKTWTQMWSDEVALPHAYPTAEGLVQLEWSMSRSSIAVHIDLIHHTAEALVSRTDDGELIEEVGLHLDDAADWKSLIELVIRHSKTT